MARDGGVTAQKSISWEALVNSHDPEIKKKKIAYEFSNGRKFQDPEEDGGAYDGDN